MLFKNPSDLSAFFLRFTPGRLAKLQPIRKHQSVWHEARIVLLFHSPYLCFIFIHTPLIHRHSHVLAQPELVVTTRNLPVWCHPSTTWFMMLSSKQRHLRAMYLWFVHHVCLSGLTEPQKWATMPCSVHNISLLKHNKDIFQTLLASREFGNTISHFKGSLKYSSARNRS